MSEWLKIVTDLVTITVPILLFMWHNREKAKKQINARHEENQKLLAELVTERKYFPAHEHLEKSGSLSVSGIRRAGE